MSAMAALFATPPENTMGCLYVICAARSMEIMRRAMEPVSYTHLKAVKPKLLALFIGVCAVGIILVGYLFNAFQFLSLIHI